MLQAVMPMPPRLSEGSTAPPIGGIAALPAEVASLRPVIRAVIACVLGEAFDHPDVEDCTHEALARAIEGQGRLRDGEPVRPWVLGIARHVALDALRRRRRVRRVEEAPGHDDDEGGAPLDRIEDPGPSPEERAASVERARRLEGALQRLAGPQREALLAFHVEGLNYQQIARRLDIPLGTVATWIARGRRSLAEALGD
jgi:RNA polymerase sigma-70 factor (ECF subfamily)